ncbi:hypothetical protein BD413DRAFT_247518 [Trametes elegans]|nr:hypothetical protein BD413DRAFT_247518 [Trametes elegans]
MPLVASDFGYCSWCFASALYCQQLTYINKPHSPHMCRTHLCMVVTHQVQCPLGPTNLATTARASTIAADLLVLVVTVQQTYRVYRASARENRPSLTRVLFEYGAVYFVVLFLFNVCDIIILQIAINGAVADIVTVLSVIMVSRFLLRLREVGVDGTGSAIDMSTLEIGDHTFSLSLVESLGRSLEPVVQEESGLPQ